MRASTAAVIFGAAVASAQGQSGGVGNYSSELDMRIDANSIPSQTRAIWCRAQTNTCGLLCDNNTSKNSCVQEELKYDCVCAGNNSAPALQYYQQTIPTFICETLFSQCDKQNVGNADNQQSCIQNIQSLCGKNAPPKVSSGGSDSSSDSSESSSASASSTSQPTATQAGNNNAVTTTKSGGLAAPTKVPAANGLAFAVAAGVLAIL
ncbi:PCI domain-containing protein [Ophiocordyceps camponoti-floridani]|uniref:PCI domain-containing protein n=1 Tax=Ophiocordyceps camponoti-floridani TaxID=2030778 RepID=A0A8H4VC90_9HYPO|nr:PCI domain-containing protein [Ophiocordyceps camponoti-floridani]